MSEREFSTDQPAFSGMDFNSAVEITRGIAAAIRPKRKELTGTHDIDPTLGGSDASGKYELSVEWGESINELKLGLAATRDTGALARINSLADPIYIHFTHANALGFDAVSVLVSNDGTLVDEQGLPVTEQKLSPIFPHVDVFSAIARKSIKEALTRQRSVAEIRSAGKTPIFSKPEAIAIDATIILDSLELPSSSTRKQVAEVLSSHDLLPVSRIQIATDAFVSYSKPFQLNHTDSTRPAYISYGSSKGERSRYPSLLYLDQSGSWRQIVEVRTNQPENWYKLNDTFYGTTLPPQLQQHLSEQYARNSHANELGIKDSLKLVRGIVKTRAINSQNAWPITASYLDTEEAVIDSRLNGPSSPNFLGRPKITYHLRIPELPNQLIKCEVIPSFNGLFAYTFARTENNELAWLANIDYPLGKVRLPSGNRTTVVNLVDESGSLAILTGNLKESSMHPVCTKYREIRESQQEARTYAKFRSK